MAVFELVIALLLVGAGLSAVARRVKRALPRAAGAGGRRARTAAQRAERHARSRAGAHPARGARPAGRRVRFLARAISSRTGAPSPAWRWPRSALTVAAVAVVARWLVPEMPWAAAIALGAIVAPPDAAAATAVLKQLRPPHRILVILEGESLFNDASALLIYRLAVTAGDDRRRHRLERGADAGRRGASGASCSARCCRGCRSTPRRGSRTCRLRSSSSSSARSRSG